MPALALSAAIFHALTLAAPPEGYYRQPAIHGDTIVFVAEGDLWKTTVRGGIATRLTSHPAEENNPRFSPDGLTVAFTAGYEGPVEAYTMPVAGGLPARLTYDGRRCATVGWHGPRVILTTERYSTLPNWQLVLIDPAGGPAERVPLEQASDGVFADDGILYFTRLQFQGSQTKRYRGGTVQQIWKFDPGADAEAVPLTSSFTGTSASPMWWDGRVYFASDRDGTMEIWSMAPSGADLRQHTSHGPPNELLDVKGPSMGSGRIVYQLGADLWLYDIAADTDAKLTITLDSDFDQMRERWVKKPLDYLTAAHISPDGDRVALTARGQVFVAPRHQGRFVEVSRHAGVRYRDARFMPGGDSLLALSDESGEVEFWTLPANGVGPRTQITRGASVLRWEGVPSPDGRFIAHHDKNLRLFILDTESREERPVDTGLFDYPGVQDLAWSPDSRFLAYATAAANQNLVVKVYDTRDASLTPVTTDRFVSYSPAWSPDGAWLYLLSDRALSTKVSSPWGAMAPEPYYDRITKVYQVALKAGTRSPFAPDDELHPKSKDKAKDEKKKEDPKEEPAEKNPAPAGADSPPPGDTPAESPRPGSEPAGKPEVKPVEIDLVGITARLEEIPVPPGNYGNLAAGEKRLFFTSRDEGKTALMMLEITNKDPQSKTLVPEIRSFELSADAKAILVRKGDAFHVIDASASAPASLDKTQVNLAGWTFPVIPREEWRQMFVESWRLMRDYFYDTDMHGVDWTAMLERYLPLTDRVSTRAELSDLIAQMVGELSALHHFVRGGDIREGDDRVLPASLGAILRPDVQAGGVRVVHVFEHDPDYPDAAAPLARPGVNVRDGDLIIEINGINPLEAPDPGALLRAKAGKQVLLKVRPGQSPPGQDERLVIVTPISTDAESNLRYHEWQYSRRRIVEAAGAGDIGYVHLRAMGGENFDEFARGFYPVYNRKGLIIDVRHNRGGNIDSWLLSRLLRRSWFYWQGRAGLPYWNMQFAFRGHVAVLCNERTASDGEAFTEGIKRLGIGKVFGTRTWGGEIWLSSSNFLVDGGIASAAEYGVYGPEGAWLIEGHGVEPDVVIDNPPHATFKGEDAQLRAAIEYLKQKIKDEPVEVPPPPRHPIHRFPPPPGAP